MDKIEIKNLEIFARHGVYEAEKELGQPFILDITLYTDLSRAANSDRVEDTVNYVEVIRLAEKILTESSYNLLEHCAGVLIDAVKREFPLVEKVDLTLKKPNAAIPAHFDYVAVNLCR